jgi:hypothetical protein
MTQIEDQWYRPYSIALYRLNHRSPIRTIIQMFYVRLSTYSKQQFITSGILYSLLIYVIILPWILTKTVWYLNREVNRAHLNYTCILVLTPLKMATWVAETCWWTPCNKIRSIKPKRICSSFNVFNAWNMEHTEPYNSFKGHAVLQWLRLCATNRKVAGSIPDGVIGNVYLT